MPAHITDTRIETSIFKVGLYRSSAAGWFTHGTAQATAEAPLFCLQTLSQQQTGMPRKIAKSSPSVRLLSVLCLMVRVMELETDAQSTCRLTVEYQVLSFSSGL